MKNDVFSISKWSQLQKPALCLLTTVIRDACHFFLKVDPSFLSYFFSLAPHSFLSFQLVMYPLGTYSLNFPFTTSFLSCFALSKPLSLLQTIFLSSHSLVPYPRLVHSYQTLLILSDFLLFFSLDLLSFSHFFLSAFEDR